MNENILYLLTIIYYNIYTFYKYFFVFVDFSLVLWGISCADIKKTKNEVDENTNEEFPELYENAENIGRYISYTSESH